MNSKEWKGWKKIVTNWQRLSSLDAIHSKIISQSFGYLFWEKFICYFSFWFLSYVVESRTKFRFFNQFFLWSLFPEWPHGSRHGLWTSENECRLYVLVAWSGDDGKHPRYYPLSVKEWDGKKSKFLVIPYLWCIVKILVRIILPITLLRALWLIYRLKWANEMWEWYLGMM